MDDRSLADDESALAGYARQLIDAVRVVAEDWILASITSRAPTVATSPQAIAAAQDGAAALIAELEALLSADIADQTEGPLQIVRRSVRWATGVLTDAGVAPVQRDEFAARAFPDDIYDLAPASFADVHPSLHEPGLVWGAAKAHVHLRRYRPEPSP